MKQAILGERARGRIAGSHLGIILLDFADYLQGLGYARLTVHDYVRAGEHFGRWLKSGRLKTADISRFIRQVCSFE